MDVATDFTQSSLRCSNKKPQAESPSGSWSFETEHDGCSAALIQGRPMLNQTLHFSPFGLRYRP